MNLLAGEIHSWKALQSTEKNIKAKLKYSYGDFKLNFKFSL